MGMGPWTDSEDLADEIFLYTVQTGTGNGIYYIVHCEAVIPPRDERYKSALASW